MPGSITSVNAVLMLSQPILFPVPIEMQQFAADDVYDINPVQSVEPLMGVDGYAAYGFVYQLVRQGITLQANSPSNDFFDTLWSQMQAAQDVYALSGTMLLPAISKKWNMTNGALTSWKPAPDGKRTLMPRKFEITWERIIPAPA